MTLGQKLRKLRKDRGLTIRELAKELNIGKTTVANYEKDARKPDYEMLKAFSEFYDVTVDYLVGRTSDPNLYIVEKESLPKELQDIGIDYITMAKRMKDKKIPLEDIEKIIDILDKEER